jgi:hypothetical protein
VHLERQQLTQLSLPGCSGESVVGVNASDMQLGSYNNDRTIKARYRILGGVRPKKRRQAEATAQQK